MPRKPTSNRSSTTGTVAWLPRVPVPSTIDMDGHPVLTVSLQFTEGEPARWRCRISDWHSVWRDTRSEAMRDMHDNIAHHMRGRAWTYLGEYVVQSVDFAHLRMTNDQPTSDPLPEGA